MVWSVLLLSATGSNLRQLYRKKKGYRDTLELDHALKKNEARDNFTPLFWHVHKAGGTTVKVLVTECLDMTVASEIGRIRNHHEDPVSMMRFAFSLVFVRQWVPAGTHETTASSLAMELM